MKRNRTFLLLSLTFGLVVAGAVGCGRNDGGSQQAAVPAAPPTVAPPVPTVTPPFVAPQAATRFQGRLYIQDKSQFAWFLDQQSNKMLCTNAGTWYGQGSCSNYANEGVIEIRTPTYTNGQPALYDVIVSPGNVNFPITIKMALYPTGDNQGFALMDNNGYRYTVIRSPRGNLNDTYIDIDFYYKDVLVARGQITKSI